MLATKQVACPSYSRDAVAAAGQWHLTVLLKTRPLHISSDYVRERRKMAQLWESREAGVLTWLRHRQPLSHLETTVNTRMKNDTQEGTLACILLVHFIL